MYFASECYPVEYKAWVRLRSHCRRDGKYSGTVTVCERWEDFENFFKDMGKRPSDRHVITRRDWNKGYEPENCYWALKSDVQKGRWCRKREMKELDRY